MNPKRLLLVVLYLAQYFLVLYLFGFIGFVLEVVAIIGTSLILP